MKKKIEIEHVTHNNTPFTLETIAGFTKIGKTVNGWRQRNVTLLQHPTDDTQVISVGITFDRRMTVIAAEPKASWALVLIYIAHGKVYRSE